ncbi:MAG: DUF1573 domain-containing protein [Verrucomicrobiota bacterium]
MVSRNIFLIAAGWLLADLAMASGDGLVFERTLVEPQLDLSETEIPVSFPYANRSSEPVVIEKIVGSCGCLALPKWRRLEVGPGETGAIEVVFSYANFSGLVEKSISVRTNSSTQAEIRLRIRAEIPKLLRISPKILEWAQGDPLQEKSFQVEVAETHQAGLLAEGIQSSRPGFQHRVEVVEEGRRYRIHLLPDSTDQVLYGLLKIETDFAKSKSSQALAYFRVHPPTDQPVGMGEQEGGGG